MGYNPNIPQSTDDPTDSQVDLLNNFSTLNTQFNINHQAFNSAVNGGLHKLVQFPAVVADPNLDSPATSLYIKTVSGESELFFQNGNAAANVKQLTGLQDNASGTNYSFLTPWGIRISCGQATGGTATFSVPLTGPATFYTAIITPVSSSNQRNRITPGSLSTTGFTYTSSGGTNIQYFVLSTP